MAMGRMSLEEFCRRFEEILRGKAAAPEFFGDGLGLLGEFLSDPIWLQEVLRRMLQDRKFYTHQEPTIYPNEIFLHRNSDPYFSVLIYLWEPKTSSAIHDHTSWGLVGTMLRPMRETTYQRLDDGGVEGFAELKEDSTRILQPGETTSVLPLDQGIHLMEPVDSFSVTLNVYGKSVRQGFIQFFDPARRKVQRIYPPRLFKRILAIRTLGFISEPWSEGILKDSFGPDEPEYLRKEYELALSHLEKRSEG